MISRLFLGLLSFSILVFAMNINDMTKFELMQVNGIGAKKADAILKYRSEHNISKVDELINVNGVGPKIVKKIKKYIEDTNKEMNNTKPK